MPTVQFRTAAETIAAFEKMDVETWSLWDSKRFMFKGTGAAELKDFLDLMNTSGASNAIYTLGYYEDIADPKKVNSKTPTDGSFNFRLNSDGLEVSNGQYRQIAANNALESKVAGLENKLDKVLEGLADPEPENKLGVIGEIMAIPALAPVFPALISALVNKFVGSTPPAAPAQIGHPYRLGQVAGINDNTIVPGTMLDQAIRRLQKVDAHLDEHLDKLAMIAEQDKPMFDYIIATLDKIPVQ